jgi:outer membrane lipoprotein carrier protein
MRPAGWVLGAALLALAAGRMFAGDTAQDILKKVRDKYDSVADAEIKFQQRVRMPVGKLEQTTAGTLLTKKGNKYRVELEQQTIVTDGVTVWSYSAAQQQVLVDRFEQDERSLSPDRILSGEAADLAPALIGRERLGKTETVVLKLTPRDETVLLKWLKLWVSESDWLVRKAELVDLNGKETVYQVLDIKVNVGIPDAQFTFVAPAGVEVVDLR